MKKHELMQRAAAEINENPLRTFLCKKKDEKSRKNMSDTRPMRI